MRKNEGFPYDMLYHIPQNIETYLTWLEMDPPSVELLLGRTRWMDGRKRQDRIIQNQARVSFGVHLQAGRPGLNQGLHCNHKTQVIGDKGPVS